MNKDDFYAEIKANKSKAAASKSPFTPKERKGCGTWKGKLETE